MSGARDDRTVPWRILALLVGGVFRIFFRLRHTGVEHVPGEGAAIVAGNHVSALDGIALGLVVSGRRHRMVRFLVAAEFFRSPWFGWALRLLRQIPLRRGKRDLGALEEAIRALREGAVGGIYPEGKVNPGTELLPGKRGVGRVALASGTAVVPVGIWGTQLRWPREGLHLHRPWRRTVALAFGPPVDPKGDPEDADDVERFVDRVMSAIAEQVALARALSEAR